MKSKRLPFTGLLAKEIDLRNAPPDGLRAALALPPTENDIRSYEAAERSRRWLALDEFFGLDSNAVNIWELRCKALVESKYEVSSSEPNWWLEFTTTLADDCVPGFLATLDGKGRGAPLEWTEDQLARLFADLQFLKRSTGKNVKKICDELPRSKGYAKRWGTYNSEGLRKQYTRAKKLTSSVLFKIKVGIPTVNNATGIDPVEVVIEGCALKLPIVSDRRGAARRN